jgi:NADPH:quinone reductase-like Zn-dependent oxidoreductase
VDRGDKLDMLRSIGADRVIDYRKQDFTEGDKRYDVIIDLVGKSPFSGRVNALAEGGRYFLGNPRAWQMLRGVWTSRSGSKRVMFQPAGESVADLDELGELVASGTIKVVIDRTYPLEQIVEAHRYVEAGHKRGIVAIDIPHDE